MKAPEALLNRIGVNPDVAGADAKRLVIVMGQLGEIVHWHLTNNNQICSDNRKSEKLVYVTLFSYVSFLCLLYIGI